MKKNLFVLICLAGVLTSCVDDYLDAREATPLDGLGTFITTTGDEVISSDTDEDEFTFVPNGGTARVEISVVDAPGLIDSISVTLSNIQLPEDWGTIILDGFDALVGQTSGTFTVVYQAPLLDENSDFSFAVENALIQVFDGQGTPKSVDLSVPAFKTVLSQGSDCFGNTNLVGFYDTVTSGFDAENGASYSDLEAVTEVYLLKSQNNNPGWIRITDGSFGLYGLQGFGGNFINVEVCGDEIVNANEEFEDLFSGTIDESTGVISITWSNSFGDSGVSVLTPQ